MLTMGVDIGSTACKCIIMEDGREIKARAVVPLGTGTQGSRTVFEAALRKAGKTREEIERILVTGYGRFTFEAADSQKSEITCHATGVHYLLPTARTVVDIGGQDVKALRLSEDGLLDNFVMNDKCAAGTGRFLDVMAGVLDVKTEELGELSSQARSEVSISNTCTDTTMGCRLSKLQVLSNRKIITVRLTAGNRMNKDSSLSASIYMSSVLSPGWSHQWLPYSTTAKSVGSRPGRCSRQAYGYADCLDRYCLGRIRINSHNTINPVNFQEIRTSSVHTGHI